MDHEFHSIVEKLAILEGRIAPKDSIVAETATKQKKPALFNNLKKKEESAMPMVGGVEFAEEKSDDVLSKVKASLADYLKSAEESVKQDKDLLAKKKQDLDLKKKELRDLELQQKKQAEDIEVAYVEPTELEEERVDPILIKALNNMPDGLSSHGEVLNACYDAYAMELGKMAMKSEYGTTRAYIPQLMDLYKQKHGLTFNEAIPETLEEDKLSVGDPIIVTAPNEYEGMTGEIVEFSPSGKFVVVNLYNGGECSMHLSDVEFNQYADDEDNDYDDEEEYMDEDPNQTPAGGEAVSTLSDPTYAEESAPVKTVNVELDEMGGSVLVEIHGDERNGFCIKRAGKEMPTKFKTLEEVEMALEMFNARRKAQVEAEQSADYIDEA